MNDSIYFLILSIVPFLGFIGEYLFKKTKIHSSLWLILFGVILGNCFLVNTDSFKQFSSVISGVALAFILFNSGLNINIKRFINVFNKGLLMTLINMIFSFMVIFIFLFFFIKINLENALIIAIILSGISSIAVIPLIDKLETISETTKIKLILESTLTDVFVIVLSLSLYQYLVLGSSDITHSIKIIFTNFIIGMFVGIFFGILYLKFSKEINKEEYPYVFIISLLFLSYFMSEFLGGSGGISSLFFGLVLGNGRHFSKTFFIDGEEIDYLSKHIFGLLTFLIVSFFFVYMGLFFNIFDSIILIIGFLISFLVLIARIFSIYLFGEYFGIKKFEKKVVSCIISRGLSAGIMAFMFYDMNFLNKFEVNIIFSTILFTLILMTISVHFVLSKKNQ